MRAVALILFPTLLFALPVAALVTCCPNKDCPIDDQEPEICASFSGSLSFSSAEGFVQGRVVMQQWQIANGETTEIPHQGLLIVQLRAGALVTEIEGERKEWTEDSFWSVPPGKRLIIHTARDSVVLQTVDFIPPSRVQRSECPIASADMPGEAGRPRPARFPPTHPLWLSR